MKKVFKYGTGQEVPEGAIYLTTIVEPNKITPNLVLPGFIWHYFLVEVEK